MLRFESRVMTALALVMAIGAGGACGQTSQLIGTTTVTPTPVSAAGYVETGESTVTDFTDRRRLVGFVEHVFVGRVEAYRGMWVGLPAAVRDDETRRDVRKTDALNVPLYDVNVVESIKGALPREIVLAGPSLDAGGEYIFATNAAPNGEWQMVVSRHGSVRVRGDRDRLVRAFRRAYETQVVYVQPSRPAGTTNR